MKKGIPLEFITVDHVQAVTECCHAVEYIEATLSMHYQMIVRLEYMVVCFFNVQLSVGCVVAMYCSHSLFS